ncbi:MAG: NADH-quinone oxidoreductase subunit C, partial [Armatimonadota bacterium]
MLDQMTIISELTQRFPELALTEQKSIDGVSIIWLDRENLRDVLRFLKYDAKPRYAMLFDLTAIDERARRTPTDQPASDFTLIYRLLSLDGNSDICLKVPLLGEYPSVPTITDLWMNANWY